MQRGRAGIVLHSLPIYLAMVNIASTFTQMINAQYHRQSLSRFYLPKSAEILA